MYNSSVVGSVVIIKDIIFNSDNKKEVDHARKMGRPCLIIHSDSEYDYFLVMTHSINERYKHQFVQCLPSDYEYKYDYRYKDNDKYNKKFSAKGYGFINLEDIYKRPVTGYGTDEIGKLKISKFKSIIEELKEFHKDELNERFQNAFNVRGSR